MVNSSRNNSVIQWTAEEIGNRLGISTAVYQKMRLGARHIAEIRQAGIERIEISLILPRFDYRDRSQVAEVLGECEKQGVKVVGVHGWVKLSPQTEDEGEWKVMVEESLSVIRFAEEVGPLYTWPILDAHKGRKG